MKLQNKKTGEIVDFAKSDCLYSKCEKICFANNDGTYLWYYSLADLFEDWEDYEEPKGWWYIDVDGEVCKNQGENDMTKDMKQIGNYFETKEEAEKAVEKLKAWKRLKDKGFRFTGWEDLNTLDPEDSLLVNRDVVDGECVIGFRMSDYADCIKDLDTLFGGGE